MPITEIDGTRQLQDLSLPKEKLEADFLNGGDLNLTNGNNDATLTGLKAGVNPNDAINKAQFDAAIGGISGDLINKGPLDASTLGSQLDNAENGFWYKVTVAGTLFGTNPIQLDVGDNLYCQNTVVGTPTDGADFFKVDNTESADLLRDADIVNDLTTGGTDKVLSAQQGVVLKGLVDGLQTELDDTQAGAGLNTDGSYTANGAANYINAATSLKNADDLLDAQVKVNADAIANLPTDVYGENPARTIGSPVLTALANIPVLAGTARVYLNGLRMFEGGSNDYTINETTGVITFNYNMKNKDNVLVDYKY